MTLDRANATPWNVLWSSFRTMTRQGFPSPVPTPFEVRSRGGVSVFAATRGTYQPSPDSANLSRSRAHSSAGERSLHTREVPGSIPGAPILGNGFSKPILPFHAVACPSSVQARAHHRV